MTAPFDSQSAIDRYLDEEIDPASFAQLRRWLENDPAAAAQFAERAFLHSRLNKMLARPATPGESILEQQLADQVQELSGMVPAVAKELLDNATQRASKAPQASENLSPGNATDTKQETSAERAVARSPLLGFLDSFPAAIHPIQHPLGFFLAAVVLTSLFWGLAVMLFLPGGAEPTISKPALVHGPQAFTARVTHLEKIVWAEASQSVRPRAFLSTGQRLRFQSGRMDLLFGEGARVAVEGPATIQIDGRNALTIERGRALARVESSARGFLLQTPTVSVVDLGTEFGVSVKANETEVQVFEGVVEIRSRDERRKLTRRMRKNEAALFQISDSPGLLVKELKMNRTAYLSLAAMLTVSVAQATQGATITLPGNRDTTLMRTTSAVTAFPGPGTDQSNNVSRGGQVGLQVGTAGGSGAANEARILIDFDLSSMPAYDQINSITMRMYFLNDVFDVSSHTPFTLQAFPIAAANADWVEGTGGQPFGTASQNVGATWNHKNKSGSVNWAGGTGTPTTGGLLSAGTDYEVTMLASYSFTSTVAPANGTPIDFIFTGSSAALTNLIDNWMTLNPGILLKHSDASTLGDNRRVRFHSTESATLEWRPELIISYEAPIPPAPEPTSGALLGIGGLVLLGRTGRKLRQNRKLLRK